jgi:hypothetical protein
MTIIVKKFKRISCAYVINEIFCHYPSTNNTLPPFRPVVIDVVGGLNAVMGSDSTVRQNIYKHVNSSTNIKNTYTDLDINI